MLNAMVQKYFLTRLTQIREREIIAHPLAQVT
jgi:hypothetical protein